MKRLAKVLAVCGLATVLVAAPPQHTKMLRFESAQGVAADGSVVVGSAAKLTRDADAIRLTITTSELPAGAYTFWWVIFNNPGSCVSGCGEDDLFRPAVMASVFYGGGGAVDPGGVGYFRGDLGVGELPALPGQIFLPGPPLLDSHKAEVHVVLKNHGPVVPSIAAKQTSTSFGGCSAGQVQPPDPVTGDRLYPCYDPQAAVFPPAQAMTGPSTGDLAQKVDSMRKTVDAIAQRVLGYVP